MPAMAIGALITGLEAIPVVGPAIGGALGGLGVTAAGVEGAGALGALGAAPAVESVLTPAIAGAVQQGAMGAAIGGLTGNPLAGFEQGALGGAIGGAAGPLLKDVGLGKLASSAIGKDVIGAGAGAGSAAALGGNPLLGAAMGFGQTALSQGLAKQSQQQQQPSSQAGKQSVAVPLPSSVQTTTTPGAVAGDVTSDASGTSAQSAPPSFTAAPGVGGAGAQTTAGPVTSIGGAALSSTPQGVPDAQGASATDTSSVVNTPAGGTVSPVTSQTALAATAAPSTVTPAVGGGGAISAPIGNLSSTGTTLNLTGSGAGGTTMDNAYLTALSGTPSATDLAPNAFNVPTDSFGGGYVSPLTMFDAPADSFAPPYAYGDSLRLYAGGTTPTASTAGPLASLTGVPKGLETMFQQNPLAFMALPAMLAMGSGAPPYSQQLGAMAQQAMLQGQMDIQQAEAGVLPPGQQAMLDAQREAARAAIYSGAAARGGLGSSALQQDIAYTGTQEAATEAQLLQQLAAQGANYMGMSTQDYQAMAAAQAQQDAATQQALGNLVGSLAYLSRPPLPLTM